MVEYNLRGDYKMAIATQTAHISQAITFSKRTDLWMELAKSSAWTDETEPDAEDASTTSLNEPLVYAKINQINLVYEKPNDTTTTTATNSSTTTTTTTTNDQTNVIIYGGKQWLPSSETDAYSNNARYVLFTVSIDVGSVPTFSWRQSGIVDGVVLSNGTTGTTVTADKVTSVGNLYMYDNHVVNNYTDDMKLVISYIAEF